MRYCTDHSSAVILETEVGRNQDSSTLNISTLMNNSEQTGYSQSEIGDKLKQIGIDLGFQAVTFSDIQLDSTHKNYKNWIESHFHGEMSYMERNIDKRLHPEKLVPDTLSVICVRMDYLPQSSEQCIDLLDHENKAYISRYALGRDYHKLIRKRLQLFADRIAEIIGDFGYRVFTDSAPVLEKSLAAKSGIGWQGKHSNILHRDFGSWFFLGEIYTDLELEYDKPLDNHCGSCQSCIDVCPTGAIVAPYVVDARKCISYLTIEHHSAIPVEFRQAIGNRIYGCDDCQLFCPWNRFAKQSVEVDFQPRHLLDDITLLECFGWSETAFYQKMEGSAIRRIGYRRWQRNLAIALGNAAYSPDIIKALRQKSEQSDELVREHIEWAIEQQRNKQSERSG